MLKQVARQTAVSDGLDMPDQNFLSPFNDANVPKDATQKEQTLSRIFLFSYPALCAIGICVLLILSFSGGRGISALEALLIASMTMLTGWEALPAANALLGLTTWTRDARPPKDTPLQVALLVTIRDEKVSDVLPGKFWLLQSLLNQHHHGFELHVLSDSLTAANIEAERKFVLAARTLPVFYHRRLVNTDFKSGNIRNWIRHNGARYDAFITLDADSVLDRETTLQLADALAADPACGLIQTVPLVLRGHSLWQRMQQTASQLYGALQGRGLSVWMGGEANYFGHNAIIRTSAFAASAGLPKLEGRALWNGTILSHDFVEAALMRRAGWRVRLIATESGSLEQAPSDVVAHLKRDARWCFGNFQHSRVLPARGLHRLSRFHLVSGMLTYVSSAVWLLTLVLWGAIDMTQSSRGETIVAGALAIVGFNLLLPRVLGALHAGKHMGVVKSLRALVLETLFSSLFAPCFMVWRVMFMGQIMANQKVTWVSHDNARRSLPDHCTFHMVELILGLGLLAIVERGMLSTWFLPVALCLALTPFLSWLSGQSVNTEI